MGKESGSGLILRERDGTYRHNRLDLWRERYLPMPIGGEGDRIWSSYWPDDVAALYDLNTDEIVARAPIRGFATPLAAFADGRVFVYRSGPEGPSSIMMFDPSVADDRTALPPIETLALQSPLFCVTEAGSIWLLESGEGLRRFDGEKWTSLQEWAAFKGIRRLTPGAGDTVFVEMNRVSALVTPTETVQGNNVEELIRQNKPRFIEAFAGSPRDGGGRPIQADSAGNIWYIHPGNQRLRVLCGDHWINAAPVLTRAGLPGGKVRSLAGIGDGGRIYLFTPVPERQTSNTYALIGEIKDDDLLVEPAPQFGSAHLARLPIGDDGGGLWVAGDSQGRVRFPPAAYRLTADGVEQRIAGTAPWLMDRGGNLWLRDEQGPAGGRRMRIWRDGELRDAPPVGGLRADAPIFSDAPGSVYVFTDLGLQHLRAPDPRRPADFELGEVYVINPDAESVFRVELYRDLLLVVTIGRTARDVQLHMVPLPKR
jgi:hypothetical protein